MKTYYLYFLILTLAAVWWTPAQAENPAQTMEQRSASLIKSIKENDLAAVKELASDNIGVSHNVHGNVLEWATSPEMLTLLLDSGQDVNFPGTFHGSILLYFCRYGQSVDLLEILINRGAEIISLDGANAVNGCARNMNNSFIFTKYLIEKGAINNNNKMQYIQEMSDSLVINASTWLKVENSKGDRFYKTLVYIFSLLDKQESAQLYTFLERLPERLPLLAFAAIKHQYHVVMEKLRKDVL